MSWRQHRPTRRAARSPWMNRRGMSDQEARQAEANREAQQSGVEAERQVELVGVAYEREGLAHIRKRAEPYRRVGSAGRGGAFTAVPTGSGGPDFEVWCADGRAGLMELKSRKGGRVPLAAVGDAQAQALARCVAWGHLALVLVRLEGVWWLVDYSAWTHVSKRSLNATDLDAQGALVHMREDGLPDILEAIPRAQERARVFCVSLDALSPPLVHEAEGEDEGADP